MPAFFCAVKVRHTPGFDADEQSATQNVLLQLLVYLLLYFLLLLLISISLLTPDEDFVSKALVFLIVSCMSFCT